MVVLHPQCPHYMCEIPRQHTASLRALGPQEVAMALGIGENSLRKLYTDGKIRSIRVGRRVLIPQEAIDDFLRAD